MLRFLLSVLIAIVIGALLGLYLGWVQFPVQYVNSPASALSEHYKDEFTVMVATGYLADEDEDSAAARLRVLGVENAPEHVQRVTERYIANSQDIDDIRALVALATGMGRLTTVMEPYQRVTVPGQNR